MNRHNSVLPELTLAVALVAAVGFTNAQSVLFSSSGENPIVPLDSVAIASYHNDSSRRQVVEIDGLVTDFDLAAGTLEVEGIEIIISHSTEYQDNQDQIVTQEVFFSRLRQGVSVVKVKWRSFVGYDHPPHELEIKS